MSETRLDGLYSKEAEIGQDDYHLFQLTATDLERLAALICGLSEGNPSLRVWIGLGCVRFEVVPHRSFAAELSSDGTILLRANPSELSNLAGRLKEMAQGESDPDYLAHTHLDTHFSSPAKGLSDVVFQRLDDLHI